MTTRRELIQAGIAGAVGLAAGKASSAQAQETSQSATATPSVKTARVRTGLEALAAGKYSRLSGLKIGLVTNPTGVLPNFTSTIEALFRAPGVKLRAMFAPEHGIRGDVAAGAYIGSSVDPQTKLPVYSVYGKTKVPTAAMLKGLDVLVFDIQDIGSRSYTYLSTMGCIMEGAAANGIPVIVLDRPNPVGLTRVEGGPVKPDWFSFVGKYPVSYLHGMTLGELAQMINGQNWLPNGRKCDLTVIPCENLRRGMATWESFGGLPWVPTSPHIPQSTTPPFYAATGITGELSPVSIGVGYPLPFELAGAPGVNSFALAKELERRDLPGIEFRPHYWTPFYGGMKGQRCGGVQIHLDELTPGTGTTIQTTPATLTRLNFEILDAMRKLDRSRAFFTGAEPSRMFDLSCGTDRVRKGFARGASASELWNLFNEGKDAFAALRQAYLIYPT